MAHPDAVSTHHATSQVPESFQKEVRRTTMDVTDELAEPSAQ